MSALLLLSAMLVTGCSSDEESNDSFGTRSVICSGCKTDNQAKIETRGISDAETITFTAMKGGWLHVEHKNVFLNCCTEDIKVDASMNGSVVTVMEDDGRGLCNCICPYDLDYEIGPFTKGSTYRLVVKRDSLSAKTTKTLSPSGNSEQGRL